MARDFVAGLIEKVRAKVGEHCEETARSMYQDMRGVLMKHMKTGAAYNSVVCEKESEHRYFIGAYVDEHNLGFKYLDQGNGNSRIYPTKSSFLQFQGYKGSYAGKWYRPKSVKPYAGIHFIHEIAEKYRNR